MKLFKSKLERAMNKAHAAHEAMRKASDHHGKAAQAAHDTIDMVRGAMNRMIAKHAAERDFHDAQARIADDMASKLSTAFESKD